MSTQDVARVVLVGAGRMGSLIEAELACKADFELVGTYDIDTISELDELAPVADLVLDFSAPEALAHIARYVMRTGAALVSGTTGLTDNDLNTLEALAERAPVIHSANFSLGVAVLRRLAAVAAREADEWDIEIVETHHNKKVDAPSGTAKVLLNAVDPKADHDIVYGREGIVGERSPREIGVHALRGGTIAGTHEVHFFGVDEELVLTHRANSRQIFVAGALAAAKRLLLRGPGLYSFDQLMFS